MLFQVEIWLLMGSKFCYPLYLETCLELAFFFSRLEPAFSWKLTSRYSCRCSAQNQWPHFSLSYRVFTRFKVILWIILRDPGLLARHLLIQILQVTSFSFFFLCRLTSHGSPRMPVNRPFPISSQSPFQGEARCEVFVMKISFHSYWNQN